MSDMKKITGLVIFLFLLLSFSNVQGLDHQKLTLSSFGTVSSQESNELIQETFFNGIWTWKKCINTDMLREMVSHEIFNIFMYVGYPTPDFDPRLSGIVPETNYPISVTPDTVQHYVNLLKSVDSRLKLWAWFGTYSILSDDDSASHSLAKVDLSTAYNRGIIIENMVEVASWGFYGVQEDTENIIEPDVSTRRQQQVDFWNELQVALNPTGVKLSVFCNAGYPSLWDHQPPYEFVKQLDVDYIILTASLRDDPVEQNWKNEMIAALNSAKCPCIINTQSSYGSGTGYSLDVLLGWQSEINADSQPNYIGNAIYCYEDSSSVTSSEWFAWHNYFSKS
jgi:hypothetical protein